MATTIQPKEVQDDREPISLDNIGSLYFDIQSAMEYANVSKPTLYKYINNEANNIIKYKIKNNTYLHIQDIKRIKKEAAMFKEKHIRVSKEIAIDNNNTTIPADYIKQLEQDNQRLNKQLKQQQDECNKLKDKNIELSKYKIKYEQQEQDFANLINNFLNMQDDLIKSKKYEELYNQLKHQHDNLQNKYDKLDKEYKSHMNKHADDLSMKCNALIKQSENYQVLLRDKIEDKSNKLINNNNKKKSFWTKLIGK